MALAVKFTTLDCADAGALGAWWAQLLGGSVVADWGGFVLVGGADGRPVLGCQTVPEPKAGKNRAHLDLEADDREREVGRAVAAGATVVAERGAPGLEWTVLADPQGNEFCIAGPH
jgi:predicted enzyme related to lactoylglutathione lyase